MRVTARRSIALLASIAATASIALLLSGVALAVVGAQEQVVDTNFLAVVTSPAYDRHGPTVAIDEAHGNFHTAGGQYKPFADLLTSDGYHVIGLNRTFDAAALADVGVLVVSNARNTKALQAGDLTQSAFSSVECDALRDWVRRGGSLLLIADHAPFGHAAAALASRFEVGMGKGWAFDRLPAGGGITTQLEFLRDAGALGEHPILAGRGEAERIRRVRSFTGQSLIAPDGAIPLLKLSATAREAATPDDLDAEANASVQEATIFGSRSVSAAGRMQGLAMPFGDGRVVVLGEAAMLSAQVIRYPDGREMKMGMNVPGTDDRQFALNVMHWLSRLIA